MYIFKHDFNDVRDRVELTSSTIEFEGVKTRKYNIRSKIGISLF